MDAPIKQVPRPSSASEPQGSESTFVIQRNTLTLYISFAAIILSCASAAVNLFTFYAGGQQKMRNEADQILLKAQANRVLRELDAAPTSHPKLRDELATLYQNINYRPTAASPLSVFERAAFSLVVEAYAIPLREVQLKRAEVLSKLGLTLGGNDMCDIDVHDPVCPPSQRGKLPDYDSYIRTRPH